MMRLKKIPSVKQEGEGQMEPSADEDEEVSGGIGEMDQTTECMVCFTKVVELCQKKNKTCFGYG